LDVYLDELMSQIICTKHCDSISDSVPIYRCLLSSISKCSHISLQHQNFMFKWIPALSEIYSNESLWEIIFGSMTLAEATHFSPDRDMCRMLDALVIRCAAVWSDSHVLACQRWILSQDLKKWSGSYLSCQRAVRFLVVTGQHLSFQYQLKSSGIRLGKPFVCADSQENARASVSLAMLCGSKGFSPNNLSNSSILEWCEGRNKLPNWLSLIMYVAQAGKSCCQLATNCILDRMSMKSAPIELVQVVILRLYCSFPLSIPLGNQRLRVTLLEGARCHATPWMCWRCPLDNQLKDMMSSLSKNPQRGILVALGDRSKQHPLLTARHFSHMAVLLQQDGTARKRSLALDKQRGRTHASMPGFVVAETINGKVKLRARHWGYSFTELLWMSILDILLYLPKEVIFHNCSIQMGLCEVFATYIRLIAIQRTLQGDGNTARIKQKFTSILAAFRDFNPSAWNIWIKDKISDVDEWGEVGYVLAWNGIDLVAPADLPPDSANN